ncbi:MAG: glycosyltransferase family 39 protein [Ignavibacteria bacterium]|nr:glycosyltransferase family 39 protein [Ignavibacteria bacterium]
MQPWDEGMYATRVVSIHINGDFIDQSQHSIQKFYSGSHPPLLIWVGYLFTLIFGLNSIVLKIIPFITAILSIYLLIRIGEKVHSLSTGYFAAMIFSSNIIFSVFSKRFQFDIPYNFLILLAFYIFIKQLENRKFIYNIYLGLVFGACLMIKILVGTFIPMIIFITYILLKKKIDYKITDLITFSLIGIAIALPWHLYMYLKYGDEFLKWFFFYHIYERAFFGVEYNVKSSGVLYHINYILSIIPYSILIFPAFLKDLMNFKNLSKEKLFIWIWFLIGFIIITFFKTKLEVYILLILSQTALIIPEYLYDLKNATIKEKAFTLLLIVINVFWALTFNNRNWLKDLFKSDFVFYSIITVSLLILIYIISFLITKKINIANIYYIFILLFFFSINIVHMIDIPWWENSFELSSVKNEIDKSGKKDIIYIAGLYENNRANPQFSFYFKGLNIGWKNSEYTYHLLETKRLGTESVKNFLDSLPPDKYSIIVERDEINRTEYDDTKTFIPEKFKLILKKPGYELYW